mmetsp:Transcript_14646/g.32311  ORF Transcript_14646/g.32311 Transcript_14646/m.32311 type:complete len:234 (-) Transcript_14646:92-793(-)
MGSRNTRQGHTFVSLAWRPAVPLAVALGARVAESSLARASDIAISKIVARSGGARHVVQALPSTARRSTAFWHGLVGLHHVHLRYSRICAALVRVASLHVHQTIRPNLVDLNLGLHILHQTTHAERQRRRRLCVRQLARGQLFCSARLKCVHWFRDSFHLHGVRGWTPLGLRALLGLRGNWGGSPCEGAMTARSSQSNFQVDRGCPTRATWGGASRRSILPVGGSWSQRCGRR